MMKRRTTKYEEDQLKERKKLLRPILDVRET